MSDWCFIAPRDLKRYIGNDHSLKCFHLNAQSARNKHSDIELLLDQFGFLFDIIMLTETWYSDEDSVLCLPAYNTNFLNRTCRRGGGVALLTKKNLCCEILSDFSAVTKDYEILCLRNNQNVFAVCYRPPDGNVTTFFEFFHTFLSFVNESNYNIICGGDFNINMLVDSATKRDMITIMNENCCVNTICSNSGTIRI